MMLVFNLDRKTDRASKRDELEKCVPEFRTKTLNCLKTVHSSIFKGLKEITSGCLPDFNFMNCCVG